MPWVALGRSPRGEIRQGGVNLVIGLQFLVPTSFASTTVMSEAPSRASKAAVDWSALPGGVVDGNEIVVLAVKPSMWRALFDSGAWLVTCGLLMIVLVGFQQPIPGLSLTATVQLLLLAGSVRLAAALIRWVPTWYVLTNRRVLDIRGVRSPRISSCLLLDIRNTYLNRSSAERLTKLGSITFVTDHPHDPPRTWQSIAEPDLVHDKIRREIEKAIDQQNM